MYEGFTFPQRSLFRENIWMRIMNGIRRMMKIYNVTSVDNFERKEFNLIKIMAEDEAFNSYVSIIWTS